MIKYILCKIIANIHYYHIGFFNVAIQQFVNFTTQKQMFSTLAGPILFYRVIKNIIFSLIFCEPYNSSLDLFVIDKYEIKNVILNSKVREKSDKHMFKCLRKMTKAASVQRLPYIYNITQY